MIDYGHTLPQSLSEDDIYGKMARTLPRPVVPEELILTSDNFDDRIKRFEKTAILFYLSCKSDFKILSFEMPYTHNFTVRVCGEQDTTPSLSSCLGTSRQK